MYKNRFLFLLLVLLAGPAAAQRLVQPIDSDWQFRLDSVARTPAQALAGAGAGAGTGWQLVSLPTPTTCATTSQATGYYRGAGWYRKVLHLPATWQVRVLAGQLDSLTRRLDPSRATMLACHGDFALYQ